MAEKNIGYDFAVKGEAPPEYVCLICHLLLREATELPNCHHVFCKQCLRKWEEKKLKGNENGPLNCSLCQSPYQRKNKHSNLPFDRVITTSLDVFCKQHENGCKWCGKIIDYQDHIGTCQFVLISCRFPGCDVPFLRKDRQHHELECGYRLVQCKLCGADQKANDMENHQQESCPNFELKCPNSGCDLKLKRKDVVAHFKDCLYEKVSCEFYDVGCKITVLKRDLEQHNTMYSSQHSRLLLHKCIHQDQELKSMKENLAESNKKLEKCIAEKNEFSEKLDQMDGEINQSLQNCFSAIENSTKILSQYLLETNKVLDYDGIIKQGEPFNLILPLLQPNDRKFQKKFPPALPLHNTAEIEHKSVKYNFAELNAINKELSFFQYQQQEQHQLQQLTHQRKHKEQYENKIEYFYNHSMEQGLLYRSGDEEVFFKLKMASESPIYFYFDPKIQNTRQSCKKGSIIFQSDDLILFHHLNAIALHIKIEEYDHKNSDAYLYPYRQGCERFLLRAGVNNCPQAWSDFKGPKEDVLFYIKRKAVTMEPNRIKKARATSLKFF